MMVKLATPLEVSLAKAAGASPLMIRFWAARLVLEIAKGRRLTPEESQRLASKVSGSFPHRYERGRQKIVLWPEEAES